MDFLISILPESITNLPVHMDFKGQQRAERTFQFIIILFAAVGFVWGYICQHFSQTVYILGAGFLLSCLLTLPPWPIYRRSPLAWQPARNFEEEDDSSQSSQKSTSSKQTPKGKKKK